MGALPSANSLLLQSRSNGSGSLRQSPRLTSMIENLRKIKDSLSLFNPLAFLPHSEWLASRSSNVFASLFMEIALPVHVVARRARSISLVSVFCCFFT